MKKLKIKMQGGLQSKKCEWIQNEVQNIVLLNAMMFMIFTDTFPNTSRRTKVSRFFSNFDPPFPLECFSPKSRLFAFLVFLSLSMTM